MYRYRYDGDVPAIIWARGIPLSVTPGQEIESPFEIWHSHMINLETGEPDPNAKEYELPNCAWPEKDES
jgi:hypothetical protein